MNIMIFSTVPGGGGISNIVCRYLNIAKSDIFPAEEEGQTGVSDSTRFNNIKSTFANLWNVG